jgi:hypothetical protein
MPAVTTFLRQFCGQAWTSGNFHMNPDDFWEPFEGEANSMEGKAQEAVAMAAAPEVLLLGSHLADPGW